LWVDDASPVTATDDQVRGLLAAFGYEVADLNASISAFQRHYRPGHVSGIADGETLGVLKALLDHS